TRDHKCGDDLEDRRDDHLGGGPRVARRYREVLPPDVHLAGGEVGGNDPAEPDALDPPHGRLTVAAVPDGPPSRSLSRATGCDRASRTPARRTPRPPCPRSGLPLPRRP